MMTINRIRSAALALTLPMGLSGCLNFAPDHTVPPLATEPAYNPDYRPDGTVVASTLTWQQYFTDPRLDALIGQAVTNNRDLVAATARIEQARAQYRIQDSRRVPTVGATGGVTRSRFGSNGAGLVTGGSGVGTGTGTGIGTTDPATGAPTDPGTGAGVGTGVGGNGGVGTGGNIASTGVGTTLTRYQVGVGVSSFELDFWGRLANLSEAARAQYLSTIAAQRAFYLSLVGDVAGTYFQLVEAQEQIALAQRTAQSREEGLRIARLRLNAGVDSALPFRQAETLLTQAQQQLAQAQLAGAQVRNQLVVLVGGRLPADLPDGQALAAQDNGLRLDPGLPSTLLFARPDIVAAEEQLRGIRANIGAARAAFFPSIALTGNAGLSSTALGDLFQGGSFLYSIGPTLSLPLFDGGARRGNLDLQRALEVEQVANYDLTVQIAFREVSDGLAGREYLARQIEVLERAVEAQSVTARLANLRNREGVSNFLEVLDAERNLFVSQQQLLATRRAYLVNGANLFVALGGGFGRPYGATDPLAPPVE